LSPSNLISSRYETWGKSRCSAICGPTWAVSPSIAWRPVITKSKFNWRRAPARAFDVARVSAPANFLSLKCIALSAPSAKASRKISSAWGGPIVITVTWAPNLSFSCRAISNPPLSSGFIILGTPSLIRVPLTGSNLISLVSGTCFIQTTISISAWFYYFNKLAAITIFWTSEVPS